MKRHWRIIFFLSGLAAVILMLLTFDADWTRVKEVLSEAGIWFPVIVLLWGLIYLINACSFGLIINDGTGRRVPFGKVFQLTVSGYALNYVTPLGLMGGEPYRILELQGYLGGRKATSAVILYSMMHICSHFCFWLSAVVLYVVLHFTADGYGLDVWMCIMLSVMTIVFVAVLWFFSLGYRKGFVVMPYMFPDPIAAKRLEDAGAACVMPLGAMIGSNKGLRARDFIEVIIKNSNVPVIIDAGIGRPSQAAEAMEMGADAVMAYTAIASAGNIPLMARAFKNAIEAGREAYLSGLGKVTEDHAVPSSPTNEADYIG